MPIAGGRIDQQLLRAGVSHSDMMQRIGHLISARW